MSVRIHALRFIATAFAFTLSSAVSAAPLLGLHQDASSYGGDPWWNNAAQGADYVHAQISRNTISWKIVEPNAPASTSQHSYAWSQPDGAINALLAKNIPTIAIIIDAPSWTNGSSDPYQLPWTSDQATWDKFVAQYATFAGEAAKHFKGRVKYYEIWNEPNEQYFWKPSPQSSPTLAIQRYGQLFTQAKQAIISADPSAEVAIGGVTGLGASCCVNGLDYIHGLMNNNVPFKYVGIHPYSGHAPDVHTQYDRSYDDTVATYKLLQSNPQYSGAKLWLTEVAGYSSDAFGEQTQADYIVQTLKLADNGFGGQIPDGTIEMLQVFVDNDRDDYAGIGLFTAQWSPKQSARAVASYMASRPGFNTPAPILTGPGSSLAPEVTITRPSNNAYITDLLYVEAQASASKGLAGVQFQIDGMDAGHEVTTAPYHFDYDVKGWNQGMHKITAVVRDIEGRKRAATNAVSIYIGTTSENLTAAITQPSNNQTVSGVMTVQASASGGSGIAGVQFQIDGMAAGQEITSAPYTFDYDVTGWEAGQHVITAVVRDTNNLRRMSDTVVINVKS